MLKQVQHDDWVTYNYLNNLFFSSSCQRRLASQEMTRDMAYDPGLRWGNGKG